MGRYVPECGRGPFDIVVGECVGVDAGEEEGVAAKEVQETGGSRFQRGGEDVEDKFEREAGEDDNIPDKLA
jgi:hypothetical protein